MRMSSQRQPKHMKKVALRATSYRVVIPTAAFALVAGLGQAALAPTTVFAEESETTAVEQVAVTPTNGKAISVIDGSTQSYTGDVTSAATTMVPDGNGKSSLGPNGVYVGVGNVTLDGSVDLSSTSGAKYGVDAGFGSSVVITGDVSNEAEGGQGVLSAGRSAAGGTSVEIGGNVDATMIGVNARYGATVNVGGDVTTTDEKDSVGVMVDPGSTVVVGGDVTSPATGAELYIEPDASPATLIVDGTISGGNAGLIIHAIIGDGADVSSLARPIIVAKGISSSNGVAIKGVVVDKASGIEASMTESQLATFAKAINYIVDPGENEIVSGTTTITVDGVTYTVAHEGDTVVLRRPDGSTFSVAIARGTGLGVNAVSTAATTTSSETDTDTSVEKASVKTTSAETDTPVKTASKRSTTATTAVPQTSDDSPTPFAGGMVLLVGATAIGAGAAMRRRSSEE